MVQNGEEDCVKDNCQIGLMWWMWMASHHNRHFLKPTITHRDKDTRERGPNDPGTIPSPIRMPQAVTGVPGNVNHGTTPQSEVDSSQVDVLITKES